VERALDPACVAVCPTRCMTFGDIEDPASAVSLLLEGRTYHAVMPEAGTDPHIFYLT
jgi:Fe-S-cluster-containing dehydrogenase component